MPFKVGDDFFDRNRLMVMEWIELAGEGDVFVWEGDGDPDVLLTVMQYWRNLAQVRHDLLERGEAPPMHPDAERFTHALRRAVFDALVVAGRMTADYADRMEATWPTLSAPRVRAAAASAAGDGDVAQHERHAGGSAR
jgi:hypothetical protein